MCKFLLPLLSLVFLFQTAFSQTYEFYGLLKLEGKSDRVIPYKLSFTVSDGKIKGYSITDFRGENETKNLITGSYDTHTKILTVKERNIVYTKAPVSKDLFCFVNFTSKIKLSNEKVRINTSFNGLFKNNQKCIDGKVELIGSGTLFKLLDKVDDKIQNTDRIPQSDKQKYNARHVFDSLQTQNLTNNQTLNVFVKDKKLVLEIWDGEVEDGDQINLYFNGVKMLTGYTVLKQKKMVTLDLMKGENKIKIEALNEGSQGLNTVMVKIAGDNSVNFRTNLATGQSTSVSVFR